MQILKSILSKLDLDIGRHSKRSDMIRKGQVRNERESCASRSESIGKVGTLELFAEYILRSHECDQGIEDFLRFYTSAYPKSRSQWSQDVFVMYVTCCKMNGVYLEIGGADGVTHSNTIALRDQYGWIGTLAEPDPEMFEELKWHRGSSDTLICGAAATDGVSGTAAFRRSGQLSSLVGHEGRDFHYDSRMLSADVTNVELFDLTELIKRMGTIDYFSLDVEGAEFPILNSLRWNEIKRPGIITVEHNSRLDDIAKLKELLRTQGYFEAFSKLDWVRRGDLWLVHRDYPVDNKLFDLGILS